jgi:hypothetical protein
MTVYTMGKEDEERHQVKKNKIKIYSDGNSYPDLRDLKMLNFSRT